MTIDHLYRGLRAIGLMSLGIGLLFFSAAPLAAQHPLEKIPGFIDRLPVHYTDLEQQLLSDAADGVLDTFDLIDAGLIASGAGTPQMLLLYRHRIKSIEQHAGLSIPYDMYTAHRAQNVFNYLHLHLLRRFETRLVTALDLWHGGKYNCLTASWIYLVLAQRYDLPIAIIETPMHAHVLLRTDPPIVIELTLPARGFNFSQTREDVLLNLLNTGLITPNDVQTLGEEAIFTAYLKRQRELTPLQVIAVFFYNRALDAFERGDVPSAFQYALAAHLIHPEDGRYHRLTRDFGRAYATSPGDIETESREALVGFLKLFSAYYP